ncbi:MAG: hypothetical protein O2955_16860 [Planctomycetota bacterium]|nr:hypothetical protein [Planctomycetota bacterium]MDA1214185.1 hypothetical protein [Planctomycetota bacterium]
MMTDPNKRMWGLFCLTMTGVALGIQLLIAQPLLQKISSLEYNIATMQNQLASLTQAQPVAGQTTSLLASLQQQASDLPHSQSAIESFVSFRRQIEQEAVQTQAATGSLDDLLNLQMQLVEHGTRTGSAQSAMNDLADMQDQLIATKANAADASVAIAELSDVATLAQTEAEQAATALAAVKQLGEIKAQILVEDGESLGQAKSHAARFVELKNRILEGSENTESALSHAESLLTLETALVADDVQVATAATNLNSLIDMQSRLGARTNEINEALGTLEILTDLHDQLQDQVASMEGIRRHLVEFVLLESTINKAVTILKPLSELANFRRMTDEEIRSAARAILDERASRVTQRIETSQSQAQNLTAPSNEAVTTQDDSVSAKLPTSKASNTAPAEDEGTTGLVPWTPTAEE